MFILPTDEEIEIVNQKRKANEQHFAKYLAKLNEAEKAEVPSKKKKPYYLQKEWLIERAGNLLGLMMAKRIGPEPQLVIYPYEAAMLLKKTIRTAQNVLKKIREKNNKAARMPVTLQEFCGHFGFDIEEVKKELTQ